MEFIRGNRTISDSISSGKERHSVKQKKGYVEYIGQMLYTGYRLKKGIDLKKDSHES